MTYPQQPYPPQGQPQYAPAPMAPYAQNPTQMAPYAPQAYYQPQYAPQPPPAPALAKGTLDQFTNQATGGNGPSLFKGQTEGQGAAVGTAYVFQVARQVRDSDVTQQTQMGGQAPAFYRDGNPKLVLTIPVRNVQTVTPDGRPSGQTSPLHPEGMATLYAQGGCWESLSRCNEQNGLPQFPEEGAWYYAAITGTRPTKFQPAKVYEFRLLQRGTPSTAAPQTPPAAQPHTPAVPSVTVPNTAVQYTPAPAQMAAPVGQPIPTSPIQYPTYQQAAQIPQAPAGPVATVPGPAAAQPQYAPQAQQAPAQPQYAAQPPAAQVPQAPPGLDPEAAARFTQMLGGQGAPPAA